MNYSDRSLLKLQGRNPVTLSPDPYLLLNAAAQLFEKTPADLNEEELGRAAELALKEGLMQQKILESVEAAGIPVDEVELEKSKQEIEGRFPDHEAFIEDIERNGMDEKLLTDALRDALRVEKVMQKVAASVTVADEEVAAYYHEHTDKFFRPELRQARHILITINDQYKENRPKAVKARLAGIATELAEKPGAFADLAMRHSECPTALEGGLLGKVPQGKLFANLDAALFSMQEGEISGILKSPMGMHLILCEKIYPEGVADLEEASDSIRQYLLEPRARQAQRAWIKGLFAHE